MSRRAITTLASLFLGVVLAAAVSTWAGVGESWTVLRRIGLGGCAQYAGFCFLILLLQGVGWWILLRGDGQRAGFLLVLEGMLVGHALSYVTPSAFLGGEPARAWLVARRLDVPMRRTFATVLLHKFQELSGFLLFLVLGIGVVTATRAGALSPWITAGLAAFCLAATAFFVAFFASFVRGTRLLSRTLSWLVGRRREQPRQRRWLEITREIEDLVNASLTARPRATMLAHALTAATLGLVWLKPAVLLHLAGTRTPFTTAELALFFVTTQVLMAFQPTPGGLGVFEGGFTGVYALLGVAPHEAMAFMATVRFADAVVVGTGLALAARLGWRTLAEASSPPEGR